MAMMRHRVESGDLAVIARGIMDGSFELKPGCYLEVPTAVSRQASQPERDRFLQACAARGVRVEAVSQTGSIDWVCPEAKKPKPDSKAEPKGDK